jgi:hypothetical protein
MEKRVVGGRNLSPEACLTRLLALPVSKMPGLLKQIIGKSHGLRPSFLLKSSLFGLAPEIEVGDQPPLFDRFESLHDLIGNVVGDVRKSISLTRTV